MGILLMQYDSLCFFTPCATTGWSPCAGGADIMLLPAVCRCKCDTLPMLTAAANCNLCFDPSCSINCWVAFSYLCNDGLVPMCWGC